MSCIVISTNAAWNAVNFRGALIRALLTRGHDVIALAPHDEYADRLTAMGARFVPIEIDNKGTNPLTDARLFSKYIKILKHISPDIYLGYTIKPNIYGSLAARNCKIPVINTISGLGTAFIRDTWLTWVVKRLYRSAFAQSRMIYFQNENDQQLFIQNKLISCQPTALLPGSGVDLSRFAPSFSSETEPRRDIRFLLVARLLYDKGIAEYVSAAKILKNKFPEATCAILGFLDVENRTAVRRDDIDHWVQEGVIQYLGAADDVRPHIAQSDCVVLPSYREGTPRTLLEAAAMGKPLIATDVPGCREVVDDGYNGLLCKVRDANDLASKMLEIANMSPVQRSTMGSKGRVKVENEFDERLVIQAYTRTLEDILCQG